MIYTFDNRTPVVGEGSYVSPTATVIGDVRIGTGCYIGHGAILRGDYGTIVIDDETAVEEGVIIHAAPDTVSAVGKRVTLGHGAIIHSKSIGDWSLIGMGAVVSLDAVVGAGTIVAEWAVVRQGQTLPDGVMAGGIPAKVIRSVSDKDREFWAWGKQLYVDLAKKYLEIGMQPVEA